MDLLDLRPDAKLIDKTIPLVRPKVVKFLTLTPKEFQDVEVGTEKTLPDDEDATEKANDLRIDEGTIVMTQKDEILDGFVIMSTTPLRKKVLWMTHVGNCASERISSASSDTFLLKRMRTRAEQVRKRAKLNEDSIVVYDIFTDQEMHAPAQEENELTLKKHELVLTTHRENIESVLKGLMTRKRSYE